MKRRRRKGGRRKGKSKKKNSLGRGELVGKIAKVKVKKEYVKLLFKQ